MSEPSATRRQLEASIRALLPDDLSLSHRDRNQPSDVAAAGVGGLLTGYLWGRWRGRRVRSKKAKG